MDGEFIYIYIYIHYMYITTYTEHIKIKYNIYVTELGISRETTFIKLFVLFKMIFIII